MLLALLALIIGVAGRDSRRLFAEHGLGYFLGIVGTFLILTLLLYPLRKRYRILAVLGNVRNWFQVHMMLGVVGPLAILYHANFSLGSINSTAALISMLLVAGSGLIGRFLYQKIHHGLFGRKKTLKELLAGVKLTPAATGGAARFVPELMDMIAEFDRQVLQPPKNLWECTILPFKLGIQTRLEYRKIVAQVRAQLREQAYASPIIAQHEDRLVDATAKFIREHFRCVRSVANYVAYDRLFALWHKVHLPFFYLMLVTTVVHIIAVHWYSL